MVNAQLIDVIRGQMSPEQLKQALVYLDPEIIRAGEATGIVGDGVDMPFDGNLVFADLAPQFNWAHPCLFILVSKESDETRLISASFPPKSRGFPHKFQLLMQYGQVVSDSS